MHWGKHDVLKTAKDTHDTTDPTSLSTYPLRYYQPSSMDWRYDPDQPRAWMVPIHLRHLHSAGG